MSDLPSESPIQHKYLCVDFLNTEYQLKNARVETLTTAPQVVDWLLAHGVFPEPADQAILRAWAQQLPDALLALIYALRTDFRQLLAALHHQQPLPPAEFARLQTLLQSGSRSAALVATPTGWQLQSRLVLSQPAALAVPLAESLAGLLVAGEAVRIKTCANAACSILFYDTTKNQSRAWCSACGTRAKALRYYHKQKTTG